MNREFTDLCDQRLIERGNKILASFFYKGAQSIRQASQSDSEAKATYRFLSNNRVSEQDIVKNMSENCKQACKDKYVLCIQDTTEINLMYHTNRIQFDDQIGKTNGKRQRDIGFFLHPCLVIDANTGVPYGYSDVKIWNREMTFDSKYERDYQKQPIEEKESYRWLEVSKNTQQNLEDVVKGMLVIQDREGDIYEQFVTVPNEKIALLIRSRINRRLAGGLKLYDCVKDQEVQTKYSVEIAGKGGRKPRQANIGVKYKEVEILRSSTCSKDAPESVIMWYVDAEEIGNDNEDKITWRLLTTIPVEDAATAQLIVEWYNWRWIIEEVFKILKKDGFNIEGSQLEYAGSIRKLSLLLLEVIIKLFLMRIAYSEPELEIPVETCFNEQEVECLEALNKKLEGKTEKQKNPFGKENLSRHAWVIARLGGWKGYEWKRRPGINTFYKGIEQFNATMVGWQLVRDVYTR